MDTQELRDATFEAMEVGEVLGPVELVVDDHLVKSFAFTVDDYHSWVMGDTSPFGNRVAHAALLVPLLLRLLNTKFDPNTEVGLHQKEEVWFHSPARVGESVILRGEFVDKYVKRGKGYIVTDATARSAEDGRLLVRHQSTEIARVEPGVELGARSAPRPDRWVKGEWPQGVEPVRAGATGLEGGKPALGPGKEIHQDQMSVFSNVQSYWRNIHTDIRVAKQAGFPSTVAQGLMATMHISEFGTLLFGEHWFTTGWTYMTFVHPVFPGDRLSTRGVVLGRTPHAAGERVELEVWQENQDGLKTTLGWISATVPAGS